MTRRQQRTVFIVAIAVSHLLIYAHSAPAVGLGRGR